MDGATGAVVSNVNDKVAVPVLPDPSVSLATIVCAPSDKPTGVKVQTPLAFAIVVPSVVDPSWRAPTPLEFPEPVSVPFEVIESVDEAPVSWARLSVTTGPVAARFHPITSIAVTSDVVNGDTTPGVPKAAPASLTALLAQSPKSPPLLVL